ncbi:hypothetical protein G3I60_04500 [Streptomyces sp. SID13666]|uniref:DUF6461 domain-containing protein n=1 Tax=unclassified Streptomyces TaxID=2593676 RepID=UPI0013C0ACB0|nr:MULTISPECIES: DUF6461 domain-containing protein [unclassified Streptomyces]NEA53439.1 hypothetical protein [Streptomyces sp. SID13666]NEA69237.1 hypothetical protein [Streptomyces sp. SID13588]
MEADTDAGSLDWARAWMCVTFTRGLAAEEVLARYGADPSRARLLDADEASELVSGDLAGGAVSLLRSGRIGAWAFCVEEDGVLGSWAEPLAELSRGTETYSVLTTEGLDVFQYWRDGECVENFEPGMEHTRPERPGSWWSRVEAALAAHEGEDAGMVPVVALLLDHLGITLDDAALTGSWPSLTLAENDAPAAPLGDTYAGEGPVPPGTVLDFGPSRGLS